LIKEQLKMAEDFNNSLMINAFVNLSGYY